MIKRNSISDFNKTPTGSINSITKSPKITTSTSTSLQGYKKRSKSVVRLKENINFKKYKNFTWFIFKL